MSNIVWGPDGRLHRLPDEIQTPEAQQDYLNQYVSQNQGNIRAAEDARRAEGRRQNRNTEPGGNMPWNDTRPGFFGGLYSGIVHDMPLLYNLSRAALDPNPANAATNQAAIRQTMADREAMGDWTGMEEWVGMVPGFEGDQAGDSLVQNLGDFSLWFRETLGRTFPAMAAGVGASFMTGGAAPAAAAGSAGLGALGRMGVGSAVGSLASYPYLLSEYLSRNFLETTADGGDPDYNFWTTAGLAVPAAAVEGLSISIVPGRILTNIAGNIASRSTARVAGETLPEGITQGILAGTAREFVIGAGTGATEETIQSWLGRVAAPGVEALGPEAFQEYTMSALAGALMEGPIGAGLYSGARGVSLYAENKSRTDSSVEEVQRDLLATDEDIGVTPTYVPADVNDIVANLQQSKNRVFNRHLQQEIENGTYADPAEARAYLGRTANVMQNLISIFTPEGVRPQGFTPEAIDFLSDEQATHAARVTKAAGMLTSNGLEALKPDAVFNTGNEQLDKDRRFLNEYTATVQNKDGTSVPFNGFSPATLYNMTPSTTRQLANYLRLQQQVDPRNVDPNAVNIQDAINRRANQFNEVLDAKEQQFTQLLEQKQDKERTELLHKENPILDAIQQGIITPPQGEISVFNDMFYSPDDTQFQQFKDDMKDTSVADMKTELKELGADRIPNSREAAVYDLYVRRNIQNAQQKQLIKDIPKTFLNKIQAKANSVMTNAKQAGISPAQLLQMPPAARYSYVAQNMPEAEAKRLTTAINDLNTYLTDLKADGLVDLGNNVNLDIKKQRPPEPETNVVDYKSIEYRNIEQTSVLPEYANSLSSIEETLTKALPGKNNKEVRDNIMKSVQDFENSAKARAQVTALVYGINNLQNLTAAEGQTLFFVMRDLGFFSDTAMASMRKALPKYVEQKVKQMESDPKKQETLQKDFTNMSPDIMLSEAWADGLRNNNRFPPGALNTNMSRARNKFISMNTTNFRNILGNTWNTPEVKEFMIEQGQVAYHNEQITARSASFTVPENLRGSIDAIKNPREFDAKTMDFKGDFNRFRKEIEMGQYIRTLRKLAQTWPTLASLVDFVEHHKDTMENYAHHFVRVFNKLAPFNDPPTTQRTKRALARLSLMRRTGQRLDRRTPDGRILYEMNDPDNPGTLKTFAVPLTETEWIDEVSASMKAVPQFFRHMLLDTLMARDLTHKGSRIGEPGTTAKDLEEYIQTKEKTLGDENVSTEDKKILKDSLQELKDMKDVLAFSEYLLDPAVPYFPQIRQQGDMFKTYWVVNEKGEKIANPHATGMEANLKLVVPVEQNKKGKGVDPDSEAKADAQAQREFEEIYLPFYKEQGAAQLKPTPPTARTRKEHFDVNAGFEAFMGDLTSLLRKNDLNSEASKAIINGLRERQQARVGEDILTGQMQNMMMRASNIGGFDENYLGVLGAYFSSAPYMLASVQHAPLWNRVTKVLEGTTRDISDENNPIPEDQRKWLLEQWEYMTEPVNDFQQLRSFNFFYALGFNYSTGILNLFAVPTLVYPSLALFSKGPVQSSAIMGKASKAASNIISRHYAQAVKEGADIKARTIEMLYDENLLQSILGKAYSPVKAAMMVEAIQLYENHLQQTLMEENFIQGRVQSPELTGNDTVTDSLKEWKDKSLLVAGGPIHFAERFTRLSAFIAYMDAMTNAEGTVDTAAVESYITANKDNEMFNTVLKNRNLNDSADPATAAAIAAQLVKETHGVYDKTGRGLIQRGLAGSLFFPFMTYPLTVLEFLGNMAIRSGPQGKATFALSMLMFFTFAGLSAIPGMESWKELYELWERFGFSGQRYGGRSIDADERMYHYFTETLGMPDELAQNLIGGVLSNFNWDMHRRIGVPMPWENLLLAFANPGDSFAQTALAGVPGRAFADVSRGHFQSLLPVAAQNILKATKWPTTGIATRNDILYRQPEDVEANEVFLRAIGIQPMSVTMDSQDSRRIRTLSEAYLDPAIERLRRDYESDAIKEWEAYQNNNPDRARSIRERMERRLAQFRTEVYTSGGFVSLSMIDGIRRSGVTAVANRSDEYRHAIQERGRRVQPQFDYQGSLEDRFWENYYGGR